MVLEKLGESIQVALKKLVNMHSIDEKVINEIIKDIQKSLIMSDVDIQLVLKFSKNVKNKSLNEPIKPGVNIREHVLMIVYDELIKIIGKSNDIILKKQKIMVVGLQGSGKTTTISKLAYFYQKKGLSVSVIGADTFRAGAYHQLKSLCDKNNIFFYGEEDNKNPINIIESGLKVCNKFDIILVDTAGRHSLEEELIIEMKEINSVLNPDSKFLVLDGGIGQLAKVQAKSFNDSINITGIIITKLDGTAKGGGALSAISEIKVPILFIGIGENISDFEVFNSNSFISRLLGLGDIKLLLSKIKEAITDKDINNAKDIMHGKFTLNDMYQQMEAMNKLGPLKQILQLLPIGNFSQFKFSDKDLENTSKKMKQYRVIMDSMTNEERENPKIIDNSRIFRIMKGSGRTTEDIKELLKYYHMMQNMLKNMNSRVGSRNFKKLFKKNN